jgi:hypothetical protein
VQRERERVQSVELGLNAEVRQILEELRICSAQQLLLDTLALLHHGAGNGLPGSEDRRVSAATNPPRRWCPKQLTLLTDKKALGGRCLRYPRRGRRTALLQDRCSVVSRLCQAKC